MYVCMYVYIRLLHRVSFWNKAWSLYQNKVEYFSASEVFFSALMLKSFEQPFGIEFIVETDFEFQFRVV